jgi:Right handed beta helix region
MHDVFLVPLQFPTIQSAIDAVVRASTIMISPGQYAEEVVVRGKESVVIQSALFGRRGVTIGGIAIDSSAVWLSGLAVRGRGISADAAAISLQECVVANGAGMSCRGSSVRVQKSMIGGIAGVGLHLVDCKAEIAGSSIQTNDGGGVRSERCRLRMWRSRVTDNAGGGIRLEDPVRVQIGGSVISGNDGGGIVIDGDRELVTILKNSVVRQNYPTDVIFLAAVGAAETKTRA